jgi:hypothetical protein
MLWLSAQEKGEKLKMNSRDENLGIKVTGVLRKGRDCFVSGESRLLAMTLTEPIVIASLRQQAWQSLVLTFYGNLLAKGEAGFTGRGI